MRFHLFTNNCHAHWNAIGEHDTKYLRVIGQWKLCTVQIMYIMYTASVTDKQTNWLQYFVPASGRSNNSSTIYSKETTRRYCCIISAIICFLNVAQVYTTTATCGHGQFASQRWRCPTGSKKATGYTRSFCYIMQWTRRIANRQQDNCFLKPTQPWMTSVTQCQLVENTLLDYTAQ